MNKQMRLIDADALSEKLDWDNDIQRWTLRGIDDIDELPTVDAVEVVRCKDCKYGENYCDKQGLCTYCQISIHSYPVRKQQDEFCSYGERRSTNA